MMSDRVHTWLVVGCSVAALYCALAMINIQVSLKYETGDTPCVSMVSGRDLCADYERMKWLTWAAVGTVLTLIGLSRQLVRKK